MSISEKLIDCVDNFIQFNQLTSVFYYLNNNENNITKLACFDLDHTLIKPKGKRKLPKDSSDYEYFSGMIHLLNKLSNDGFTIVIFSNQSGSKYNDVIIKMKNIITDLLFKNIKINVFIASKDDYYRKPHTGMFDLLLKLYNINTAYLTEVFYCGDAAGRPKDFACSDYAFAYNLSLKYNNEIKSEIKFYVPEELYDNKSEKIIPKCFDNSINYVNDYYKFIDDNSNFLSEIKLPKPNDFQEIIIMSGLPGSGKSQLARDIYKNKKYIIVSKDEYKTRSITMIKQSIKQKLSVVVDDTNVDVKNRSIYIELAKQNNLPITCINVMTDINMCKHLNDMRVEIGEGKVDKIPDIAYNVLNKKYVFPNLNEGFNNLYNIPFMLPKDRKDLPKQFYYIYNSLIKFE